MERTMRRITTGIAAVGMVVALAGPAAAGSPPDDPSGPVTRYEADLSRAYFDVDDGLVALGGPPPEEGCFGIGFDGNGQWQEIELPNGAVVTMAKDDDQPMYLYEGTSISDVCDQVYAGETPELLASGTVRVRLTDNDLLGSGTRASVWGDFAFGQLVTTEGETCQFVGRSRYLITPNGDFQLLQEDITLTC